jgi:hypothetical protein
VKQQAHPGGDAQNIGHAAGVVIVAMAQDEDIRFVKGHTQLARIFNERVSLPRVKEDAFAFGLHPQRQSVLRGQSFACFIVNQYCDQATTS